MASTTETCVEDPRCARTPPDMAAAIAAAIAPVMQCERQILTNARDRRLIRIALSTRMLPTPDGRRSRWPPALRLAPYFDAPGAVL